MAPRVTCDCSVGPFYSTFFVVIVRTDPNILINKLKYKKLPLIVFYDL